MCLDIVGDSLYFCGWRRIVETQEVQERDWAEALVDTLTPLCIGVLTVVTFWVIVFG